MDLPGTDDCDFVKANHLTEAVKQAKIMWVITDKNLKSSEGITKLIKDSQILENVKNL